MLQKTAMLRLRQVQGAQCLIKKYRLVKKTTTRPADRPQIKNLP
jgi:hypothetical protein